MAGGGWSEKVASVNPGHIEVQTPAGVLGEESRQPEARRHRGALALDPRRLYPRTVAAREAYDERVGIPAVREQQLPRQGRGIREERPIVPNGSHLSSRHSKDILCRFAATVVASMRASSSFSLLTQAFTASHDAANESGGVDANQQSRRCHRIESAAG